MNFDKKDLETINKVFAALSKAKWDNLDGNAIVEIHTAFIFLKKLEDKIKQGLETPAPVIKPEIAEKKKTKKSE